MDRNEEAVSGHLSTATYPNKYNVVIPLEAPFFRTGIKVLPKGGTQPLIEGLDYYLGYYYQEAAEAFEEAIYGGIILLNTAEIDYEIVPVGHEYRIPSSEIGKWLVAVDIKDPRNVDWSSLMRYAPTIPAIDPPQDLEEARQRDDVVAAIYELCQTLEQQAHAMDDAYTACANELLRTGKKIYEDGLYQHHLIPNVHPYTGNDMDGNDDGIPDVNGTGTYARTYGVWQATYSVDEFNTLLNGGTVPEGVLESTTEAGNCLMVGAKAADATLAFGRTFNQLVTLMSTSGIQQRDIDALMDTTLGHLYGRMAVENGETLTYKTANDNHIVEIHNGSILLKTKYRMELAADRDNNESGVAAEVSAGLNSLMVHSGANIPGPVFNGAFLITPDQVSTYLHEVTLNAANAYMVTTPTVTVYGNGKKVSPFQLQATPPNSSPTVEGLLAVTDSPTGAPLPSTALSQAAVTNVRDDLALYVDDTFTINGVSFNKTTQTITLTKANMGLGNANNTAASTKPVSTALAAALALKSLLTHTHTINDVNNKPTASGTVAGMMQLQDSIDANTTRAITSRQGFLVDADIDALELKSGALMPAWSIIGQQYGHPDFMPIPAKGNYEGYLRANSPYMFMAMRLEENRLYLLRNGWNGITGTEHVYYGYADVALANGQMSNFVQSSFRYHPQGLTDKYPGVTLKYHMASGADVGFFLGDDGLTYAVQFDGTMDYRKHTKVNRVSFETILDPLGDNQTIVPAGNTTMCFVYKDEVYAAVTYLASDNSNGYYRMVLFKLSKADQSLTNAVMKKVVLTGSRFKLGDWNAFFKDGGHPTTEDLEKMAWAGPVAVAKWTNARNVVHSYQKPIAAVKNGVLRVGYVLQTYIATASMSIGGVWCTSYVVDLEQKTVTLEGQEKFPMELTDTGVVCKDGTNALLPAKMTAYSGNIASTVIEARGMFYIGGTDPSLTSVSAVYQQDPQGAGGLFEFAKYDFAATVVQGSSFSINKGAGSAYVQSMAYPLFLGGSAKTMLLSQESSPDNCISCGYTTDTSYNYPGQGGFGPSNARNGITAALYEDIARLALVKTGSADLETLDGAKFIHGETRKYRNVAGTTTLTAAQLTVSQMVWDGLLDAVKSKMLTLSGAANGYAKEYLEATEAAIAGTQPGKILMSLWVIGVDAFGGSPLYLVSIGLQGPRAGKNAVDLYQFIVTGSKDGSGNVTFPVPNPVLGKYYNTVTYVRDNGLHYDSYQGERQIGQVLLTSSNGTDYFLYLANTFGLTYVGNSGTINTWFKLTKTGNSWAVTSGGIATDSRANPDRITYVKDLGGFVRHSFNISTAILSGQLTPYDEWIATPFGGSITKTPVVLASMETASGWILYITEEVYLYVKQTPIQVPTLELDLEAAFPGQNANQTFYVHVEGYQDVGVWKGRYVVSLTRMADSDTLLYIGTVKTDSNRITVMDLNRVKRMGRVRPLIEHSLDPNLHVTSERMSKHFSPLDGVAALPLDPAGNSAMGYLSLLKAAKQAPKLSHFMSVPIDPASGSWYTPSNPVEKFWSVAPVAAAVVAGTNPDGAALGMINIGYGPKLDAGEKFGVKVKVTTTSATLRMKISVDDNVQIRVDGLVVTPGTTPGYMTVTVVDKAITPGEHTVTFEVGEGPGFSPCYIAYILYDFDGTTERELARSNATTKIGMVNSVLDNHKSGSVISAATMRFGPGITPLNVTNRKTGVGLPHLTEADGSDTLVHYPTLYYPFGAAVPVVVSGSDAVVNLMST